MLLVDVEATHVGVRRSDLVQEAIRSVLFARGFRTVGKRMRAHAQARAIQTDEDIATLIS